VSDTVREGDKVRSKAVVVALLPGALVKVKLESGEELTAHVAEELKRVTVSWRVGDRVQVERAERDPGRGSIVGVSK
jgi:translation initiation factor IF-1